MSKKLESGAQKCKKRIFDLAAQQQQRLGRLNEHFITKPLADSFAIVKM